MVNLAVDHNERIDARPILGEFNLPVFAKQRLVLAAAVADQRPIRLLVKQVPEVIAVGRRLRERLQHAGAGFIKLGRQQLHSRKLNHLGIGPGMDSNLASFRIRGEHDVDLATRLFDGLNKLPSGAIGRREDVIGTRCHGLLPLDFETAKLNGFGQVEVQVRFADRAGRPPVALANRGNVARHIRDRIAEPAVIPKRRDLEIGQVDHTFLAGSTGGYAKLDGLELLSSAEDFGPQAKEISLLRNTMCVHSLGQ